MFLDDIETLPRFEKLRKLEQLVNEELGFLEAQHGVDEFDLLTIKSQAINIFNETPMSISVKNEVSPEYLADWCKLQATIGFLRNQGLIKFTLGIKEKKRRS